MKRIFSILLSIAVSLPLVVIPSFATQVSLLGSEPMELKNGSGSLSSTDLVNQKTIDLSVNEAAKPFEQNPEFKIYKNTNTRSEQIDFSSAIDIPLGTPHPYNGVMPMTDNQPPVAAPKILLINPETVLNGKYTTATQFLLATRWNNQDLCYDPEGDSIQIIFNNPFPSGYISYYKTTDGSVEGYLIHIFNEGNYSFVFAFADSVGGASDIFSITFDIIRRGQCEIISGELSSLNDVSQYQITVDYSIADEYALAAIKTGIGGFSIDIFNPDGTKYGRSCYTSAVGYPISTHVLQNDVIKLSKPDGVTGTYTYTLKLSTDSNKFKDGATSYYIAYGEYSQRHYFFEGKYGSSNLPYFVFPRTSSQIRKSYSCMIEPSEIGDYFKIETTGPETVTLSQTPNRTDYRFKIIDINSFETLFDGYDLTPYIPEDGMHQNYISATINFEAGATYYLVIYSSEPVDCEFGYHVSVGDHEMFQSHITKTFPAISVTSGTSFYHDIALDAPNKKTAYISSITYKASEAGWPYEGGHFYIKAPNENIWRTNKAYISEINFDNLSLIPFNGTWQFRIDAKKTGTIKEREITFYYWFEV